MVKRTHPETHVNGRGDLIPRLAVGLMGSAGSVMLPEVRSRVRRLGQIIAERGYVLITGAAPGLPHQGVRGAHEMGGVVVGISPALNLEERIKRYGSPTRGYDAIIYTGSGLMGREIENIRSSDVVIIAGGRSGTLGEFAIAYDEAKGIGVLTGTGGIADRIEEIVAMVNKETGALICYDSNPEALMDKLERVFWEQIHTRHLAALENHDPDGIAER
ncbi:MAG: hypothetical protein FJ318_00470 [SAR202 cluster bacterium]|nr:hypothetical protein [SAR202 cluster bacterium]